MTIVGLLALGMFLIIGPIMGIAFGLKIPALGFAVLLAFGVALVTVASVLLTITKLYVKTKASEAFVRTGMGGLKVILSGGAYFVGVVHQLIRVPLETIKLEVEKIDRDALITIDKLRVNIKAEFFLRVEANTDDVQAAARAFGENMRAPDTIKKIVEPKLVSALRTVAAGKTLEELNSDRATFLAAVTQIVSTDLKPNGLTLETATISMLDQTPAESLRSDNIFDAEGLRTIAEKTELMKTQANGFKRIGEEARKLRDVENRKNILGLEQEQQIAEANQAAQVATARAQKDQEARQSEIERDKQLALAEIQKDQVSQVATREQEQAIEVAERKKQQAMTEADQELEVAQRQKQQAVATAEAQRTMAEGRLANAEAERETARQAVKTVEVTAEADRNKRQQVIKAEADAETKLIGAQKSADASAYTILKDAEARQKAAEADASAITQRATAEAQAKTLNAEADKMIALIPVEVKAREVAVDKQRIEEVLVPELTAREKNGASAQEFELAQLRITQEAQVKIETAKAVVNMVSKIEAKIFGTPATVGQMINAMSAGMGLAQSVEGFREAASDETMESLGQGMAQLTSLVGGVASHFGLKPEALIPSGKGKSEKNDKDGVLAHSN